MGSIPPVALHDGVEIPQLGYGVWQIPEGQVQQTVEVALEAGYRHIDTASIYGNERGVGAAIAATGIRREEIFLTTKLWNDQQGYDEALRGFEASLERLGLDWVDLYLVHWPVPARDRYLETWRAFEKLREEGRSRSIGVSNFRVEDLERLREEAEQMPTVNQVELHPHYQQAELRTWHAEAGIATVAWGPLAHGALLSDERIATIAARHGRSPAQVILRWHLETGNVVIPKSATPARLRENVELFDFALGEDDLAAFAGLETGRRLGPDPATFEA